VNQQFPYANRPNEDDLRAHLEEQIRALRAGRFLPELQAQTPGLQLESQTQRVEPVYEFRVWEEPQPHTLYGIGVDPAEGLIYGDDSTVLVGNCKTGSQVAEVQGKIHPFDLAELVYQVGSWYNTALVGIENNRDGGCNAKLMEMGYQNIYFLAEDKGRGYQQQTPKLGVNLNIRRRAELITQGRRWLEDGSITVVSEELIAQMEVFALHNGKFQAPKGAHDDLVMGFLIMIEMMKVQLEMEEMKTVGLRPLSEGKEVVDEFDWVEDEGGNIDRMLKRGQEKAKERQQTAEIPFMESMI